MQIRLQTLEHQQRALNALTRVFKDVELDASTPPEANIAFDPADPQIRENINAIQSGVVDGIAAIPRPWRGHVDDGVLGVDAKMETGTGKTLVYTQLMYELNRLYGFPDDARPTADEFRSLYAPGEGDRLAAGVGWDDAGCEPGGDGPLLAGPRPGEDWKAGMPVPPRWR